MSLEKILANLHEELALQLLARIQEEGVNASILKEAREFLKDNGINNIPRKGSPLEALQTTISSEDLEEYTN